MGRSFSFLSGLHRDISEVWVFPAVTPSRDCRIADFQVEICSLGSDNMLIHTMYEIFLK